MTLAFTNRGPLADIAPCSVLLVPGTPTSELTLQEVGKRIAAGEPGSTLKLTLRGPPTSPAGSVTRDVAVARAQVAVKPTAGGGGGASAYDGPAGGLFTGASGPKAPPALFLAVLGMREGGRRVVVVPPELGYDDVGYNEIPPDAECTLEVEVLSVKPPVSA